MKSIVITGSTRGIGFGLADAFLARGCTVTVNGRSPTSVEAAVARLSADHGHDRLHARPGNVTALAEVQQLWDTARDRFGSVDIWINNAGLGHNMEPVWDLPPERVEVIVNTNILGFIYGARVAIRGMLAQGYGQLYNMEGFGANGDTRDGLGVYGTTKAAVHYLSKSLISETEGTPVQVGTLSPGMVVTDLLMDPVREKPEEMAGAKRVFNILADRVESVAPFLVEEMLANDKAGKRIRWLTTPKIIWRFATAPFTDRNVIDGAGDKANEN